MGDRIANLLEDINDMQMAYENKQDEIFHFFISERKAMNDKIT